MSHRKSAALGSLAQLAAPACGAELTGGHLASMKLLDSTMLKELRDHAQMVLMTIVEQTKKGEEWQN